MLRLSLVATAIGLAIGLAPRAYAQEVTPFAHVSYTEGRVLVEHESTTDEVDGNTPLLAGDRLRTEDGRAEVLFGDGSLVQIDQQTTMDVLSDTLIRLMSGRIIVRAGSSRAGQLQIDTPAGSVFVNAPGEYHIGLAEADAHPTLDLAVVRGQADLASDVERLTVDAGQRAWARSGEAPSYPVAFNSAELDSFGEWAAARLDARRGSVSYQYVSAPLRPYVGVLDSYGSWGYEAPYGYVWYPRVDVGWRPYYHGRWRFYSSIGWTWIGGGVWAWPTHHYGRWGYAGARWFWIPGSTWGAGYVHWAVAPGYVSWCPLGFDNRPIFAFYHSGHHGPRYAYSRHGYDGWRGWTVVPRRHFGAYASVNRVAVDGRALFRQASPPAFVERAPAPRAMSASARVADRRGLGAPGMGVAVPRGTTTFDRSSSRRFSAGAADARGDAFLGRQTSPAPAGTRDARTRSAPVRDGGYISTDNGSRVYRVPPAGSRSAPPVDSSASLQGSGAGGGVRSRTAPGDRRVYAVPRGESTPRAPFTDQRGQRDGTQGRAAPADGGSFASPRGTVPPRARAPYSSQSGTSDGRWGRTAPPDRGSFASPRDGNAARSRNPHIGEDRRSAPSSPGGTVPRATPGGIAPSREMPSRMRPSPSYDRPAPQAMPRGGYPRGDARGSAGAYRAQPQGAPRMSAPAAAPRGNAPSRSYAPRQNSGSRGGGGMRQAPSGARSGSGSGAVAVPRGGRHR